MEVAPESIVRDFIYLDVERMKSVLAQLDRGLLTGTIEASGDDHSGGLNAGLSIPGLGGLGGTRNYLTRNELTETRTLHDFVYATTEAMLIADNAVLHLPDDYAKFDEPANEARARLSGASFFLAKARVSF